MCGRKVWAFVAVAVCLSTCFAAVAATSGDPDTLRFYYFRSADNAVEIVYNNVWSLAASGIRPATPTVIIIDGFISNLTTPMSQTIKNAFINKGGYNVIVLDWGSLDGSHDLAPGQLAAPLAAVTYLSVLPNVITTGQRVADFLNFLSVNWWINFSSVTIVGHSLGAHVAGQAGKFVTSSYGGTVKRISGLDPAGPWYDLELLPANRLANTDASFVDVYHTSRGVLGIVQDIGHVNIYVNGGTHQPGCELEDITGILVGYCSHSYSWKWFAASFTNQMLSCPCVDLLGTVTCMLPPDLACTTCLLGPCTKIQTGLNTSPSARGLYYASYVAL